MIPIRCFTCGRVTGNKWGQYQKMLREGIEPSVALDTLGLTRYCCRGILLAHVNIIDKLLMYCPINEDVKMIEPES